MSLHFDYSPQPVLEPKPGCPWADTMVLNPAIIADPERPSRLHMLFRASGPWPGRQYLGRPLPYPIFLGYAVSQDAGATWDADFSRPALAPLIQDSPADLYVTRADGRRVVNHANGCIEDPRLFSMDGALHLTTACRLFPPGPYWVNDEPTQCAPRWIRDGHEFGRAATENLTVSVLWRVDLDRLAARDYGNAFAYVTHLTDPERGDDRDAVLFPERLMIDGRRQHVCIHRPMHPRELDRRPEAPSRPSMYMAAAARLDDLPTDAARQEVLATPKFEWEGGRVGASFPPIRISDSEWLLGYHGKQDAVVGYTQSFMILREQRSGLPVITHRCPERMMYARQPWELAGRFKTPCLFSCAGIRVGERLLISYGAADTKVGLASVDFAELLDHVRTYDADGQRTKTRRAPVVTA